MTIQTNPEQINHTVKAAYKVAQEWAATDSSTRIALLRGLANGLEDSQSELVVLADEETHLGTARLNGELARTAFQLRGFAEQIEKNAPFAVVNDPAIAGPPPAGHPSLVRVRLPLGPVAVFAASNFPFAFSVLGGDTASALAAGCPVIVKAHPGHPKLSRRVYELAVDVIKNLGLPSAIFGFIEGASFETGLQLIRHPLITAAAFTGSTKGGIALQAEANSRKRPIPFFGELGSINPVVVLPNCIEGKEVEMATMLAQSITNGTGQFCTSPGIVMTFPGDASERFIAELTGALQLQKTHHMLTLAMRKGFDQGSKLASTRPGVTTLLSETAPPDAPPHAFLARTDANTFVQDQQLHEEIFGPAALVISVQNAQDVSMVLDAIGGSLTVTIWGATEKSVDNVKIVRAATRIAGRVLFLGVPTGVAVTGAQHHGGPWPASTQPGTTSVGYLAMDRFLRPVALQDAPNWVTAYSGKPI